MTLIIIIASGIKLSSKEVQATFKRMRKKVISAIAKWHSSLRKPMKLNHNNLANKCSKRTLKSSCSTYKTLLYRARLNYKARINYQVTLKSLIFINLSWIKRKREFQCNKIVLIELHYPLWKLSLWIFSQFCRSAKWIRI